MALYRYPSRYYSQTPAWNSQTPAWNGYKKSLEQDVSLKQARECTTTSIFRLEHSSTFHLEHFGYSRLSPPYDNHFDYRAYLIFSAYFCCHISSNELIPRIYGGLACTTPLFRYIMITIIIFIKYVFTYIFNIKITHMDLFNRNYFIKTHQKQKTINTLCLNTLFYLL